MSVFAPHVQTMSLPPRYSNTRPQPPPYKPASKPLKISSTPSIPPPIYKSASNTSSNASSTIRSSSPSPSISTLHSLTDPPQYTSIIKTTQPSLRPQPTASPSPNNPSWKSPYLETDADDSIHSFQRRNERQRALEEERAREEEGESSNWCLGCFWVGPSTQQPFVSSYVL